MRPKVICHMISSVDGRLRVERYTPLPESAPEDYSLELYAEAMAELKPDATIFGKNTIQEMAFPKKSKFLGERTTESFQVYLSEPRNSNYTIVFDAEGSIEYGSKVRMESDIVVALGHGVSENYLAHLRENNISYFFAGPDGKDLPLAMDILYNTFGIKTVALVGGATINGAFLKAGLIDELLLQVYPGIDGLSGIPSIFEYRTSVADELPAKDQRLELLSVQQKEHGVLYLHYRFHKK